MSRGRKRKTGPREPNGRPKRMSMVQRDENMREVALKQPHRVDLPDPHSTWAAEAVGRILLSRKEMTRGLSRMALYGLARSIADAWSMVRRAVDSKRPWGNSTCREFRELSPKECDDAYKEWADIKREVRDFAGEQGLKAVEYVIIDVHHEDWIAPFWVAHGCIQGLIGAARYFKVDVYGEDKEKKAA